MTQAWINRIGTAVPPHDIHAEFVDFALSAQADTHAATLFARMAGMADIEHRYAIFAPGPRPRDAVLDAEGFYRRGAFPDTAARMARYQTAAPALAMQAIDNLQLGPDDRRAITHLLVASCTGFSAPGLDLAILHAAGLRDSTERTIVGFMGCYAAVSALKLARHIVRSEPRARVLVVNVELSSLHLREDFRNIPAMLSFLLFGDGAAACLVSAEPGGIALGRFTAALIPDSQDLITWDIGNSGFEMYLSGKVPAAIKHWTKADGSSLLGQRTAGDIAHWAVHAGGRTILDAVQNGLGLPPDALNHSRGVLRDYGNMSSATLVFVLERILRSGPGDRLRAHSDCSSGASPGDPGRANPGDMPHTDPGDMSRAAASDKLRAHPGGMPRADPGGRPRAGSGNPPRADPGDVSAANRGAMSHGGPGDGIAMAFGPGLTVESFAFRVP